MPQASPKFEEENLAANLRLLDSAKVIADSRGITVGQLALGAKGSTVLLSSVPPR